MVLLCFNSLAEVIVHHLVLAVYPIRFYLDNIVFKGDPVTAYPADHLFYGTVGKIYQEAFIITKVGSSLDPYFAIVKVYLVNTTVLSLKLTEYAMA